MKSKSQMLTVCFDVNLLSISHLMKCQWRG